MLIILKFIFLVLAIMYTFSNFSKVIIISSDHKSEERVNGVQMFLMALGIVGFVFIQFKLYL